MCGRPTTPKGSPSNPCFCGESYQVKDDFSLSIVLPLVRIAESEGWDPLLALHMASHNSMEGMGAVCWSQDRERVDGAMEARDWKRRNPNADGRGGCGIGEGEAEKRCLTGAPYGRDEAIGCQISGPTPKGRFHQCSFRWFVGAEGRLSHADDATL